jgi:hypothetical protein
MAVLLSDNSYKALHIPWYDDSSFKFLEYKA